jgi:hypothetical protein
MKTFDVFIYLKAQVEAVGELEATRLAVELLAESPRQTIEITETS